VAHPFQITESVVIHAPIERCFLLSTHLAIVQDELGMRPVSGSGSARPTGFITEGLVSAGDSIRWQGWKFGLPQFHESLIEAYDPPRFFRDRMLAGRFRTFEHDHAFEDLGSGNTRLSDELRFTMPFGLLGDLAGVVLLVPHIHGLMRRRFQRIKQIAETEAWQQYLQPASA
jgi:ligand-binding SRPBCC domain-containing protein